MSTQNIPQYDIYGNVTNTILQGKSLVIYNPSTYQSTFTHTKWKKTMTSKGKEFSIIDFIADMPKPVAKFLGAVDLHTKRASNISDIGSPKDASLRSRAFKYLRKMKILKRAGRNKFMISPAFKIPAGGSVLAEVDLWNSLKPTDETIEPPPMKKKSPVNL